MSDDPREIPHPAELRRVRDDASCEDSTSTKGDISNELSMGGISNEL